MNCYICPSHYHRYFISTTATGHYNWAHSNKAQSQTKYDHNRRRKYLHRHYNDAILILYYYHKMYCLRVLNARLLLLLSFFFYTITNIPPWPLEYDNMDIIYRRDSVSKISFDKNIILWKYSNMWWYFIVIIPIPVIVNKKFRALTEWTWINTLGNFGIKR